MKQILFEDLSKYSRGYFKSRLKKNLSATAEIVDIGDYTDNRATLGLSISDKVVLRSVLLFVVFVVLTTLFYFSKAFILQILQQRDYVALADANRTRSFSIQAERGVIYDTEGAVVVRNSPAFSLVLDTTSCTLGDKPSFCNSVVRSLSSIVPLNYDAVVSEIALHKPNVVLVEGLSKQDIIPLETKIKTFPGISIVTAPLRDYIYPEAFAHLVGYVGLGDTLYPTISGKSGVEYTYNDILSGDAGRKLVRTDSTGSSYVDVNIQDPVPGKNITLYVDAGLQVRAFELLQQAAKNTETAISAGAVVAQDPKTGGILALVSFPTFNSAEMSLDITPERLATLTSDPSYPFFNRSISAVYPPGSTFKMVVAAGALVEGIVGPYYKIFDPGFIQIGPYIFRNWKLSGHGDVDLRRALQVSNDVYFYTVGGGHAGVSGLGIKKLHDWAENFGFGSKTGIDLPGEAPGFMPDGTHKDWYLGDTFISSIGQGDVLATPLQVNNMMAYFANGGYLLQPRVVKQIAGEAEIETVVLSQNLTSNYIYETIREGLKMVVEPGGTAYPLFDFPQRHNGIELAGKTGTSEYIAASGEEKTHAWFTVFGPYEDADIVLTVFLEGGGSGSDDAAPIARKLLDYWFDRKLD